MRYSIMLQIVIATTLVFIGAGAWFAWLQIRSIENRDIVQPVSFTKKLAQTELLYR